MKPTPDKTERLQIVAPAALLSACRKRAERNGEHLSELIRRGMAEQIGQPALAETRKRGQPKKPEK